MGKVEIQLQNQKFLIVVFDANSFAVAVVMPPSDRQVLKFNTNRIW